MKQVLACLVLPLLAPVVWEWRKFVIRCIKNKKSIPEFFPFVNEILSQIIIKEEYLSSQEMLRGKHLRTRAAEGCTSQSGTAKMPAHSFDI